MNRRSALFGLIAVFKTAVVSSVALASDQASRVITRIAGPHWNVNGDWNPSIDAVQAHLRGSHGIDPSGLSLEQMLAVHDNAHNRMGSRPAHASRDSSRGSKPSYGKF